MKSLLSVLIITFLISANSNAETLVSCHDGDTCKFSQGQIIEKIRFSGMDAPEIDQPFGTEARDKLIQLLKGQNVVLKCDGQHFSRTTCIVFVNNHEIQREMVRAGLALDFPMHSNGRYKEDQDYAKKNKLGMWSQDEVYSPFCWRWFESKECQADPLFQK